MEGAWSGARGGLEEEVTQGVRQDRWGVSMKKHAPAGKG